eukprot:TRINITY_DN93040_c0_g1_i1.p1 TRINITY_DN93040_c0_g1~~TRINITY_DN93040_c0_g1_i1.p1  ORF type:complete len:273 (-),score=30.53 TRINITY_DN93040_c0_g1_i1:8-826(-)
MPSGDVFVPLLEQMFHNDLQAMLVAMVSALQAAGHKVDISTSIGSATIRDLSVDVFAPTATQDLSSIPIPLTGHFVPARGSTPERTMERPTEGVPGATAVVLRPVPPAHRRRDGSVTPQSRMPSELGVEIPRYYRVPETPADDVPLPCPPRFVREKLPLEVAVETPEIASAVEEAVPLFRTNTPRTSLTNVGYRRAESSISTAKAQPILTERTNVKDQRPSMHYRRFKGRPPVHMDYNFYRMYGLAGRGATTSEFHNYPNAHVPALPGRDFC